MLSVGPLIHGNGAYSLRAQTGASILSDPAVLALLLATFILEVGSGLQDMLVPIGARHFGFTPALLGLLGTVYYLGFVAGCLLLPGTIRRVGHIRCFSALAAIGASIALLQSLHVSPMSWLLNRALFGFCFAGLFMVVESWLNHKAAPITRGKLLSAYMVATWTGLIAGKLLFGVVAAPLFAAFALCSIAISLSLVPIALTNGAAPSIPDSGKTNPLVVLRATPIGPIGAFAAGGTAGTLWTFGPLFAEDRLGTVNAGLFMAACALGGAVAQWPLGVLSDRVERRGLIAATCLLAAGMGLWLALTPAPPVSATIALGTAYGAAALPLYSLCVAHANDRVHPALYVEMSSLLLLAFGLGASVGPMVSGLAVSRMGTDAIFLVTAATYFAAAGFAASRIALVPAAAPADRAPFAVQPPVAHGTQAASSLTVPEEGLSRPPEDVTDDAN